MPNPATSSVAHKNTLIAALVCGAFGIGVSEFLIMGLLPQIAADLSADLYQYDPETAMAAAGMMVSGYALGVVTGTFTTPALMRRLPEHTALTLCAAAMMFSTFLTAISPTLLIAIILRFVAALTHATFMGLATVMIARLLRDGRHGRSSAIVTSGLTMASLLGVPFLTALGSGGQWRLILAACAVLFAIPTIVLLLFAPIAPVMAASAAHGTAPGISRATILLGVAITLITGGAFAIVTFAAPISQWAQGPRSAIPIAVFMLFFGVGMNVGNFVGGWAADRAPKLTVVCTGVIGAAGAALLFLPFQSPVTTGVSLFIMGLVLAGTNPASIVLYLRELPHHQRVAASLASGTANLGSFGGSLVGGALLASGGTSVISVGGFTLIVLGVLVVLVRGTASTTPSLSGTDFDRGQ